MLDRYDRVHHIGETFTRNVIDTTGGPHVTIWRQGPDGADVGKPTLFFVHGGSWTDGNRHDYGFVGRSFAARGFVVVVVDYRKAPQTRFPGFVTDVAAAFAWTRRHIAEFGGDPDQIIMVGHSAGAHLAMLVTLDRKYLRAVGEDSAHIRATVGLAGPYDFYPFTGPKARDALGHWPRPAETQPITYARGDAPPILLLQGLDDTTVEPRNSRMLAAAMTKAGGRVTAQYYPAVDHSEIVMALAKPFVGKAPVLEDIDRFLASLPPVEPLTPAKRNTLATP